MFTYSHANTPLGQSERAYYLSYFINIYSVYIYLHIYLLGYLKGSNAAAYSVDSDIFYAVIHLPARSKTYLNLQVVSNHGVLPKVRFKSTFPTSNDILSEQCIEFILRRIRILGES